MVDEVATPKPVVSGPKPAPAPVAKSVSTTLAMQTLKDELNRTITMLGQNTADVASQMDKFLQSIQPTIADALVEADLTTLRYVKDQVASHLGRVSLGYLNRQQEAIKATVLTTLSLLIKVGTGALVAA